MVELRFEAELKLPPGVDVRHESSERTPGAGVGLRRAVALKPPWFKMSGGGRRDGVEREDRRAGGILLEEGSPRPLISDAKSIEWEDWEVSPACMST